MRKKTFDHDLVRFIFLSRLFGHSVYMIGNNLGVLCAGILVRKNVTNVPRGPFVYITYGLNKWSEVSCITWIKFILYKWINFRDYQLIYIYILIYCPTSSSVVHLFYVLSAQAYDYIVTACIGIYIYIYLLIFFCFAEFSLRWTTTLYDILRMSRPLRLKWIKSEKITLR